MMRIGAALSTDLDPAKATTEAVEEARVRLGETEVSLAVLVTSRDHAAFAELASEALRAEVGPERVIGCVAETVVGGDREVDRTLVEQQAGPFRVGEAREIVEQPGQAQRLCVHGRKVVRPGENAVLGGLDPREQRVDGRPELVGEIGGVRLANLFLVFERLREAVQRPAERDQLGCAVGLDPCVDLTLLHALGGLRQPS